MAPARVRFFIDNNNLGFDEAESDPATQEIELDEAQSTTDGPPIALNFVKFQRVNLLTVREPARVRCAFSYCGLI